VHTILHIVLKRSSLQKERVNLLKKRASLFPSMSTILKVSLPFPGIQWVWWIRKILLSTKRVSWWHGTAARSCRRLPRSPWRSWPAWRRGSTSPCFPRTNAERGKNILGDGRKWVGPTCLLVVDLYSNLYIVQLTKTLVLVHILILSIITKHGEIS